MKMFIVRTQYSFIMEIKNSFKHFISMMNR